MKRAAHHRLQRRIAALQAISDGLVIAVAALFLPLGIIVAVQAVMQAGTP